MSNEKSGCFSVAFSIPRLLLEHIQKKGGVIDTSRATPLDTSASSKKYEKRHQNQQPEQKKPPKESKERYLGYREETRQIQRDRNPDYRNIQSQRAREEQNGSWPTEEGAEPQKIPDKDTLYDENTKRKGW